MTGNGAGTGIGDGHRGRPARPGGPSRPAKPPAPPPIRGDEPYPILKDKDSSDNRLNNKLKIKYIWLEIKTWKFRLERYTPIDFA